MRKQDKVYGLYYPAKIGSIKFKNIQRLELNMTVPDKVYFSIFYYIKNLIVIKYFIGISFYIFNNR